MLEEESRIILYTTDDGKSQVSLMSRDGRIWLNPKQIAELFAVSKPNISMLIAKIFSEKELDDSVVKFYLTTATDGKRYNVLHGPGTVSHEEAVAVSAERYEEFDDIRRKEEARLADEADMEELRRIEDEAKRRGKV